MLKLFKFFVPKDRKSLEKIQETLNPISEEEKSSTVQYKSTVEHTLPDLNIGQHVEAIETWVVKWEAPYHEIGTYWHTRTAHQIFTTEKDADLFANKLKEIAYFLKAPSIAKQVRVYREDKYN